MLRRQLHNLSNINTSLRNNRSTFPISFIIGCIGGSVGYYCITYEEKKPKRKTIPPKDIFDDIDIKCQLTKTNSWPWNKYF
jgi:hypothetical protein